MLSGPNLEETVALARSVSIPVIVSGGVSCEADITAAAAHSEAGIAGIIVGKAIYTGAVGLASALAAIEGVSAGSAGQDRAGESG
jgi:phosphoribosylformimino-5-aminoimidazole carboxamide ribotide isomerase